MSIIHLHVHVFPTFYLFYTYCDLHVYQLRLHNCQSCHFANTANPWLFFSWASWQLFTFPKEKRIYIAMFSFSLTYMQTVWIHVYPSSKHLENQNSYIYITSTGKVLQVQVLNTQYLQMKPTITAVTLYPLTWPFFLFWALASTWLANATLLSFYACIVNM